MIPTETTKQQQNAIRAIEKQLRSVKKLALRVSENSHLTNSSKLFQLESQVQKILEAPSATLTYDLLHFYFQVVYQSANAIETLLFARKKHNQLVDPIPPYLHLRVMLEATAFGLEIVSRIDDRSEALTYALKRINFSVNELPKQDSEQQKWAGRAKAELERIQKGNRAIKKSIEKSANTLNILQNFDNLVDTQYPPSTIWQISSGLLHSNKLVIYHYLEHNNGRIYISFTDFSKQLETACSLFRHYLGMFDEANA